MKIWGLNHSGCRMIISAVGGGGGGGGGRGGGGVKCLECQRHKPASLFPSQLFLFPSTVLTVFENDAAKGKHERSQNSSSVEQLSKIALYSQDREP